MMDVWIHVYCVTKIIGRALGGRLTGTEVALGKSVGRLGGKSVIG